MFFPDLSGRAVGGWTVNGQEVEEGSDGSGSEMGGTDAVGGRDVWSTADRWSENNR